MTEMVICLSSSTHPASAQVAEPRLPVALAIGPFQRGKSLREGCRIQSPNTAAVLNICIRSSGQVAFQPQSDVNFA